MPRPPAYSVIGRVSPDDGSCDKETRNFLSTPENDPCRTRGDYNMLKKQTKWSDVRILPLRPEIIRFFRLFSGLGQVDHRFGHRNISALLADRGSSPVQVVGGDGGRRCPAGPLATCPGTRPPPRSIPRAASARSRRCSAKCALPGSRARPTDVLNPLFTDATGLPLNSTKQVAISLRSRHRRQ